MRDYKSYGMKERKFFSFSKLNCFNNCEHEYFCTYILNKPRKQNIYGELGGFIHTEPERTKSQMRPAVQRCTFFSRKRHFLSQTVKESPTRGARKERSAGRDDHARYGLHHRMGPVRRAPLWPIG